MQYLTYNVQLNMSENTRNYWNAAINIAHRANHPTSTTMPVDGALIALVGKAQSTA